MSQTFAERRWSSSDGLSLYARDYAAASGQAKLPVIAIHGLTRNSADFDAIAPLIAQSGRRVLAVDVRGRGQSDRAPDPMTYQPAVYAQDVLGLMRDLGIERAVFLGTSMGGLITMALAAARSKVVVAAILNDIGPEVAREGLARIAAYAGEPVEISNWAEAAAYVRKLNAVALPHYTDADWDAFARRTFRIGTEGTPVPDYDPDIMAPIRAAGAKALVPNLWPMFGRLAKARPVLLVRGETSDLLSPDIAARMQKRAPKMDFVEVPGVGHAPMLDEPEAKAAIFPFLSELP
ncbi:MAG: alpha/beta hydrolase [Brevundimonas sp.]|uniref:alpha/beta fold hydrolase n=1 Tax=Brevundimonas sp. TaxID=1871086 RepID=UPI002718E809|nr:alpha/beta hydrolase [Brevundimonas sp.]MDO9587430.1 alpha/beta hydrolase [Brevundimonas sp.]MDP3370763.1 alpha/beta hydrolase [Brevundimonas sp.]MDP3656748.1 alpha/beta hydrolase [Brevundimonas sp.]